MPAETKSPLVSQILAGVVIALLAGGTAPWWWTQLAAALGGSASEARGVRPGPETAADPVDAYEAIQGLYGSARNLPRAADCGEVRVLVEKIRRHTGDTRAVPPSFAYTIRYPQEKTRATIGDLATDRIARIERGRAGCFRSVD